MTARTGWASRRSVIVAAVAVVVLAVALAVGLAGRSGSTPSADTTASTTAPAGSASGTPTSPSDPTGQAAPGPSGRATSTRVASPYCQQYERILAGGGNTDQNEDSVSLDELSKTFAQLIDKYSKAKKLAPPELQASYTKVIDRLTSMKSAVDDRDLDRIKAMLGQLDSLNDTMDRIQQVSRQLCG